MRAILGVLVVALFAYIGAALYRREHQSRTVRSLVASGIGFFVLGAVLGPHATNVLTDALVGELDILIDLGLGWVGLLFGLQFDLGDLRRIPRRHYLGAGAQSATSLLVVGGGTALLLLVLPHDIPVVMAVGALAAIGATSSPTTAAQIRQETRSSGPVGDVVLLATSVDALPAVVVFGVLLCVLPPETVLAARGGLVRLAIAGGLGLLLGALFHLLTLYRYNENQLLVVLLGAVVFGGGAAHALRVSPLFVSVITGVVLANLSPERGRMFRVFLAIEKPIYLVLFTLAGASWDPIPTALLALVPAFLALRLVGKLAGGLAAGPAAGVPLAAPWRGLGAGLLAHGGMAVAIALDVRQSFPGTLGDLALTVTFASVLVWALVSPRALHALLRREGEVA